ncbi:MAG: hypothetical protein GC138_00940 [Gammaproteobacteria bacterium]|nr:hypothetical protein [Gammaproteobacteria bacterium]
MMFATRSLTVPATALLIAALLGGCAGGQRVSSRDTLPDWVSNPPSAGGHRFGVGSAELGVDESAAMKLARDSATADIAKQLQVSISSTESIHKELLDINGDQRFSQNVEQAVISRVPEFRFSFLTLKDSYKDVPHARLYVLLDLDVDKEAQAIRRRISELDDEIESAGKDLGTDQDVRIDDLRRISAVLIRIRERDALQERLRLFRPGSPTVATMTDLDDLERRLLARIASVRIEIRPANGGGTDSLGTIIAVELTKQGLTVVENRADLRIVYDFDLGVIRKGGIYFGQIHGQTRLEDRDGSTIRSFDIETKGVSVQEDQARSRALSSLGGKLGRMIIDTLFARNGKDSASKSPL